MLEARRAARLAAEALDELGVLGEAAVQDLERDLAPELQVLGAVDVGHPARADAGDHAVAAVDDRLGGEPLGSLQQRLHDLLAIGAATVAAGAARALDASPRSRPSGRRPARSAMNHELVQAAVVDLGRAGLARRP